MMYGPSSIEVFELPVDETLAEVIRSFEVNVPTEDGRWCVVVVTRNATRLSYGVEFSAELFDLAPEAVTATVQLAMLAIREQRVAS